MNMQERLATNLKGLEDRVDTLEAQEVTVVGSGTTVPATNAQNQMIISNATPAWSLLAAPSAQYQILITGADPYTPAWTARFDATVPNTIEPDDAAAAGSATVAARRDHEHAIVCAVPVATGTANAEGSGTSFARDDHVHLLHAHDHTGDAGDGGQLDWDDVWSDAVHDHTSNAEGSILSLSAISDLAYATPALTLSTSNAAGSADTVIRSDATVLVFDATVPDIIQPDDAAAAGAAGVAARRDHTHGIVCAAPASPSVSLSASAEGSSTSFARADHAHQLDQAIAPTWTGAHRFNSNIGIGTAPAYDLDILDAGATAYVRVKSTNNDAGIFMDCVANTGDVRLYWLEGGNNRWGLHYYSPDDYLRLYNYVASQVAMEFRDNGDTIIPNGDLSLGGNDITNVGTVDGVDVSAHDSRHERAGADQIDGDHLDIDWNPTNYTPTTAPAEAANVDDLTAHLAGLDAWMGSDAPKQYTFTFDGKMSVGGTGWEDTAGDFYYDTSKYPTSNAAWRATLKIRTGGGPEAQIRLYDITDSGTVATLTTTNAAYQHLSASVSLDNGHYYRIQMREDTGGNFADALGTYLEW